MTRGERAWAARQPAPQAIGERLPCPHSHRREWPRKARCDDPKVNTLTLEMQ
jgi:hypothetical protein